MTQVTLLDVAHAAGVDRSTASRALDPRRAHMLRAETVERVLSVAQQLGYRGNALASGLRRGRSDSVGVVVADFQNPFIAPVLRGIESQLEQLRLLAFVAETQDSPERLSSVLDALLRRRPDALIVTAATRGDLPALHAIAKTVPLVLAVRAFRGAGLASVFHDDEQGGALAARHLAELGHRRIAQLAGPADASSFEERSRGFRAALKAAGVEQRTVHARDRGIDVRAGRELMRRVLRDGKPPTAVFAHTDLMAVGAIDALRDAGLQCPRDVSVVGYDDIPLVDHITPPLTTVRLPSYELGREAAQAVVEMIEDPRPERVTRQLQPMLVVRSSTAAPAPE